MGIPFSFLSRRRSSIGIDLGESSVKMVRLSRTKKGVELTYAGVREVSHPEGMPADGNLSALFRDLFSEAGIKRPEAVVNFRGEPPLIVPLTFPIMPPADLSEAIRWAVKKNISGPLEQFVWDFLVHGESEGEEGRMLEVLLAIAEKARVQEQLREMASCRITVRAMDVLPLCLLTTVRFNYPEDLQGSILLLDLEANRTCMSIAKSGVLRLTRTVRIGGEILTHALQRELSLPWEEAEEIKKKRGLLLHPDPLSEKVPSSLSHEVLKKEMDGFLKDIDTFVDYYMAQFRGTPIRKIFLMGGASLLPGFVEYLSTFSPNVELVNPFARVHCSESLWEKIGPVAPQFGGAVSLALWDQES